MSLTSNRHGFPGPGQLRPSPRRTPSCPPAATGRPWPQITKPPGQGQWTHGLCFLPAPGQALGPTPATQARPPLGPADPGPPRPPERVPQPRASRMGPKAPEIHTALREPGPKAAWAPLARRETGRLLPTPACDPEASPASSAPHFPARARTAPTQAPLQAALCLTALTPLTPPKPLPWLPMHPSRAPGPWPCSPVTRPEGPKFSAASGPRPSSRLVARVSPRLPGWVSPHPRFAQGPAVLGTGPVPCPRAAAPPQEGRRCYQEAARAFLQDGSPLDPRAVAWANLTGHPPSGGRSGTPRARGEGTRSQTRLLPCSPSRTFRGSWPGHPGLSAAHPSGGAAHGAAHSQGGTRSAQG